MRLAGPVAVAALGLLPLISACGTRAESSEPVVEVVIETVNGIVHVRNSGTAPSWTAEPVLRLGSVEGGADEFGRIRSVLADAEGNVYVADVQAQQIRVFSRAGTLLRTIGREGPGPGEFRALYALAWLDGNLAAMDAGNARIGVLTSDGEWIDGIRHFPITGSANHVRLYPLGDAGFYAPIIDRSRPRSPFARFTRDGPADTIPYPQAPENATSTAVCNTADGMMRFFTPLEAPGSVFAFPPDGGALANAWTASYRIAFLAGGVDTVRVVTRDQPPLAYPDALWEETIRPFDEMRERFPGTRCDPAAPVRPQHRASIRHILFDESGSMWVEAASEDGFRWDVFDAEGRLLGSAAAPPRLADIPPYVRAGQLYQVETDAMDVQYVAVYRIHS